MSDTPTSLAPPPRRPVLTIRDVRDIYTKLERIDTKLDGLETIRDDLKATTATTDDHEVRLVKLESFQGLILWIVNGGWMVIAAVAFTLAKLGVL